MICNIFYFDFKHHENGKLSTLNHIATSADSQAILWSGSRKWLVENIFA